jgi:glycosyltransferase involved in cell wall biosynthesis
MFHLAKLLKEHNYDVTVLCALPNYPTGKIFPAYKKKLIVFEDLDGIKVIRTWIIPTNSSKKISRIISLFSYALSLYTLTFWQLRKLKSDIIFISTPPFSTGYLGIKLAKFIGAKTILNVSDLWPQSAYDLGYIKDGWLYRILLKKEKIMYEQSDAFTGQSNTIIEHLKEQSLSKPTFLYRNLYPFQKNALIARTSGKRKIVYAGLLGIAQGVYAIIKQINFEQLNTELHIYGQGKESGVIEDYASKNPSRGVYFHGTVESKKLPEILLEYHAMLIPLSTKIIGAFPSKVTFSLANGLPILYSGLGEATTIIKDQKVGYLNDPNDFVQLSLNIKRLMELNELEYEELRKNCIECSLKFFNLKQQDEQFIDFLNTL